MTGICSVEGCSRPAAARTWCHTHYMRWHNHGPNAVAGPIRKMSKPHRKHKRPRCMVPDCNRPHDARGYCNRHYQRWLKHGDPTTLMGRQGRHAKLTKSQVRKIRRLRSKMSRTALAKQFNVVPATIKSIERGWTWAWLK
jgi:hypothetical protein